LEHTYGDRLADFDYELPDGYIAQTPATPRDAARLLISRPDRVEHGHVTDLVQLVRPGDALVVNDTRVLPARLSGRKETGGMVELLLLRPVGNGAWEAMARSSKPLRVGAMVQVAADCRLQVVAHTGDTVQVQAVHPAGEAGLLACMERYGVVPLPPYIASAGADADRQRYQTVFARHAGAVAAPTAGLHFTGTLLAQLSTMGVQRIPVTLHVGPGTFQPVRCERARDHVMHGEWCRLGPEAAHQLNAVRQAGGRIIAVGTTATRVLESAVDETGWFHPFVGDTHLFIQPGYPFRGVDRLMTNFHLPKSTLLMLVAAFIGPDRLARDYAHAIGEGYRFYSYGDASWLEPAP
jgi:S-adenosylmethionine:tRNA ribosyltransferase-isomerase